MSGVLVRVRAKIKASVPIMVRVIVDKGSTLARYGGYVQDSVHDQGASSRSVEVSGQVKQ